MSDSNHGIHYSPANVSSSPQSVKDLQLKGIGKFLFNPTASTQFTRIHTLSMGRPYKHRPLSSTSLFLLPQIAAIPTSKCRHCKSNFRYGLSPDRRRLCTCGRVPSNSRLYLSANLALRTWPCNYHGLVPGKGTQARQPRANVTG